MREIDLQDQIIEKKHKTGIPVLDSSNKEEIDEHISKIKKTRGEDEKKRHNKILFTRFQLEEEFSKKGPIGDYHNIPLAAILSAPEGYFSQFNPLVDEITREVQENLSASESNLLIHQARENPVNESLKKKAVFAIGAEMIKYNSRTPNRDYLQLDALEKHLIQILVTNEIVGLGVLEPLFQDWSVREIVCNGPFDIQVEIDGQMIRVPSLSFRDKNHLMELISRLLNTINKALSRTNPLERGRLYDNSRLFVTDEIVSPGGPNLNLRRHTADWVTPEDMMDFGSGNEELFTWLGNAFYNGLSGIIVGSTGSGKTTLLSALTGYFPNNKRIVTIEKNLEMKGCPSKLFAAAMEEVPSRAGSLLQSISLQDLAAAATQMRPDILILGETIAAEAYDILSIANSGHQVFTTLHANSPEDAIYRIQTLASMSGLITGKAVFELISAALDFVVIITRFPQDGSRKITSVHEIGLHPRTNPQTGELYLPVYPIWEYQISTTSDFIDVIDGEWVQVGELSREREAKHRLDLAPTLTFEELSNLY